MAVDLVDIESYIKSLPGVLGCVILSDTDGRPTEIQAFTGAETNKVVVQQAIVEELARRGIDGVRQVLVFELEAETPLGDRETLFRAVELAEQEARIRGPSPEAEATVGQPQRAHPPAHSRPPLQRVSFSSTAWTSEAQVALQGPEDDVVGEASGEKSPHGLRVLASATLEAVGRLVGTTAFRLEGASLVTIVGREAVLVVVQEEGGPELVGAALLNRGPVTEAAVRATLDAINRRIELLSQRP